MRTSPPLPHRKFAARSLAASALALSTGAVLVLGGITTLAAAPALAVSSAPQIVFPALSGTLSDTAGQTGTSGLNCPQGDPLEDVLSDVPISTTISPSDLNNLTITSDVIWNFTDPVLDSDGDQDASNAFFPDGAASGSNWAGGDTGVATTIIDFAAGAGTTSFYLAAICYASDWSAPVADSNGNALFAVAPVTIDAANNEWSEEGSPTNGTGGTSTGGSTPPPPVSDPDPTSIAVDLLTPIAGGGGTIRVAVLDTASTSSVPLGTVDLYADGSSAPLNSSTIAISNVSSNGRASYLASPTELPAGAHSIVAKFTPTDSTKFEPSTSAAFTLPAVSLTATASGTEVDLSATVQKEDGTTASDAQGTVDFAETSGTGWTKTAVNVTSGVATVSDTGLTAGTTYTFTATYTAATGESYSDSTASTAQSATISGAQSSTLTNGGTVTPGTAYDVSFSAGTFGDGDSIDVTLHSTPTDLGTSTAGSDGSLDFTLSAAATTALAAGSSHELIFTDNTTPADTQTIDFTVAGSSDSTGGSDAGSSTGGTDATGSNDPSTFLTDSTRWATSSPAGIATLVGVLVLLSGAGLAAWNWYGRRRRPTASANL